MGSSSSLVTLVCEAPQTQRACTQECHVDTASLIALFTVIDLIESERKVEASVASSLKAESGALHRGDGVFRVRTERMTLQKHVMDKCSVSSTSDVFSSLNT